MRTEEIAATPAPEVLRHKFAKQEDGQLTELVPHHGENDWANSAASIPGRNARQCRERFKNYLSGRSCQERWTDEEDWRLMQLFVQHGSNWTVIAKAFPNRSNFNVKNRWAWIATNRSKAFRGLCQYRYPILVYAPIPPPQQRPKPPALRTQPRQPEAPVEEDPAVEWDPESANTYDDDRNILENSIDLKKLEL
jgi:hypothetical protein